jgi:flagellar basal-body rod protein FlgB
MFQGLFQSTSIPVLEQVVQFSQARHQVLAGNLANIATPGYHARDLSVDEFQTRLKDAIDSRDRQAKSPMAAMPDSPGDAAAMPSQGNPVAEVAKDSRDILFHDQSQNSVELQVTEMVKNQLQHNIALSIMTSQMRQLQTAISERA